MPRFFVRDIDDSAKSIKITGEDVNHIRKVLRLGKNDEITVCDGAGNDYVSVIDEITADNVVALVKSRLKNKAEPPVSITLFQGVPKSDKMDFIIQKCVEIGCTGFVPVITERTVVKFESSRDAGKKAERWNRISLEAAKQCGRGLIPAVSSPVGYRDALKLASESELAIIPYENEKATGIKKIVRDREYKSVSILVGPEGGFSEAEIDQAGKAGLIPVSLGPRILRTETAGLTAATILLYELGDMC